MSESTEAQPLPAAFEDDSEGIKGSGELQVISRLLSPDLRCFGSRSLSGAKAKCKCCEFSASCRLVAETERSINRPLGGQSFDEVAEFAPELADYSHDPVAMIDDDVSHDLQGNLDVVDAFGLTEFLNIVLRFDSLSLGTLAALFESAPDGSFPPVKKIGIRLGQVNRLRRLPEMAKAMNALLLKIGVARQAFKLNLDGRQVSRARELKLVMNNQALKRNLGKL